MSDQTLNIRINQPFPCYGVGYKNFVAVSVLETPVTVILKPDGEIKCPHYSKEYCKAAWTKIGEGVFLRECPYV